MEKPVQWTTLQELRKELDRTRPAWETELADLDGVWPPSPDQRAHLPCPPQTRE